MFTLFSRRFRAQGINGEMLSVMEEGDFETTDFPQARPFHWKIFWSKLATAKTDGVAAPTSSAVSHASSATPPSLPTPVTTSVKPTAKFVASTFSAIDGTKQRKSIAPIHHLAQLPETDLATSLAMIKEECARLQHPYPSGFDHLAGNIYIANTFVEDNWDILGPKYSRRGMTKQRAAFINFYTHESPFYPVINRLLREENRDKLVPFRPFLKSFLQACYCLPLRAASVKRGVKLNLKDQFQVGKEVPWWSITSATDNISVLQSDQFLGRNGPRTIFDITARSSVSIKDFTSLPEEEIILLPGTILQVIGVLDAGGGLVMIQMKEKEPFVPMLDFVHPQLQSASVPVPVPTKHANPPRQSASASAPTPTQPVQNPSAAAPAVPTKSTGIPTFRGQADILISKSVSSLLGKLSVHNLNQLLPKFCALNIKTRNHLQILAHEIVSAALAMPLNCNLYAKLCAELNKQSDTFAYDIVKLGQKQVNEQQVHYYDVGDGAQGPFPSREAAAHTGRKMCSFKRALLDTCQSIFGEALKNSTVYPGACCEWCEYACSVASGCACVTERICVGCRKRGKGQTTHAGNRAIYCARISQ